MFKLILIFSFTNLQSVSTLEINENYSTIEACRVAGNTAQLPNEADRNAVRLNLNINYICVPLP